MVQPLNRYTTKEKDLKKHSNNLTIYIPLKSQVNKYFNNLLLLGSDIQTYNKLLVANIICICKAKFTHVCYYCDCIRKDIA